jgi:general secretion pathway protein D
MKSEYLKKRRILHILLVFAILLMPNVVPQRGVSSAAEEPIQPSTQDAHLVSIDFDNVDIRLIIKLVSEWTGNNYLIDDQVRGNVTIISPTKIPIDQAVMVMESILEVKGFSTVPAGNVIKIIPAADAKGKAITTYVGKDMGKVSLDDRFITQIVPLQYTDAGEVRALLAPLMSRNSSMFAHLPSNTLIITDIASNVHRLMDILRIIDVESKQAILTVIPLKYSQSTIMANQLNTMIQAKQQALKGRIPVRITPDDRTNSLVILTPPEEMESLKQLIKELDIPTPPGTSTVHVYKLKNSEAAKLAPTLTSVFKSQQPRAGQQAALEQPNIVADEVTNSLIIIASSQDYENIEAMLQRLDIMRRQVLVEALIAEVSMDKSLQLGIEWQSLDEPVEGSERVVSDIIYDASNVTLAQSMAAKQGFVIGLMKGSISGIPNIGTLLHAFQKDASVNILSTPHLLCLDNENAKIIISDNVPYITSSTSLIPSTETTTSTPTVVSSFGFKDVGITLDIKPYIGEDSVRLHIKQTVEQLNEALSLAGQPATIKREADTNVIAGNGETIVIGGLVRDDKSKGIEKVPLLGNIPLLGIAFRRTINVTKKTNLLIFLSPHIIATPEEARLITEKKKQEGEEFFKGKAKDKKLNKKEKKESDGDKK